MSPLLARSRHARSRAHLVTALLLAALMAPPVRADPPAGSPGADVNGGSSSEARSAERPIELRVVSFNVWAIPLVSKDLGSRLRRLPAALRHQRADVICLQELWTGGHQRQIARAMANTHPHAAHGDGGLLTLSRQPLHGKRFTAFPTYGGLSLTERLAGKGFLETIHRVRGVTFRVINTHLAFTPEADSPRVKQLRHLTRAMQRRRDAPVLLVGDLNTASQLRGRISPELVPLHRAGFVDANPPRAIPALAGTLSVRSTRIGWPRPDRSISFGWDPDHILGRGGPRWDVIRVAFTQALDTPRSALSDHDLIAATWRLVPARAPR